MGKQTSKKAGSAGAVGLFPTGNKRKHPRFFLPKYLTEEADRLLIAPAELVWKRKEDERAHLRAELDAAYFHLYQLSRPDVEYILGTFQGIAKEDERADGLGRTRQLVLETYDRLLP